MEGEVILRLFLFPEILGLSFSSVILREGGATIRSRLLNAVVKCYKEGYR